MSRNRSFLKILLLALVAAAALSAFAGSAGGRTNEAPRNNGAPTVSDTQGQPLTAVKPGDTVQGNNGSWFCNPPYPGLTTCKFDFQWERCNAGGGSCVQVPGATAQRYTTTQQDAGSRLRVAVTATNYDCNAPGTECRFVSVSAYSGQTPVVANPVVVVAKPASTAPPTITGIASEREVLTAADGAWSGPGPITTARQWLRCDTAGNGCANIPGATAATYTVAPADVGLTIRVTASATNSGGTSSALSAPTAVVTPLAPRPGRTTLSIADVSLPQRLLIDRVLVTPRPIRSLAPFVVRFRVSDTRGFRIVGALVQAASVPPDVTRPAAEVTTGRDGWASVTLRPTTKLQLRRGSLYLFVRARKPGENLLAGVSTRQLVRVPVAAPIAVAPATTKASAAGK
ncbi:MAG: hypothetical protein ABI948_00740 [Thermoleophilia bacterium]